jgi:hypothetical protein
VPLADLVRDEFWTIQGKFKAQPNAEAVVHLWIGASEQWRLTTHRRRADRDGAYGSPRPDGAMALEPLDRK